MVRRFLYSLLALTLPISSILISPPASRGVSSSVVISEFRTRGPSGGNDEFIELYNLSPSAVNIGGWEIRGSNNSGTVSTRAVINSGTILNPGCHYLLTNSNPTGGPYSGPVAGNQTYGVGITDDGGIALAMPSGTLVEQVGLSSGAAAFKEGTVLTPLTNEQEKTVFAILGILTLYKLEEDSDYHLVVRDEANQTIITEIACPCCVGETSPFAPAIANARAKFDARFTATGSFKSADVPVMITGVGFLISRMGRPEPRQTTSSFTPCST